MLLYVYAITPRSTDRFRTRRDYLLHRNRVHVVYWNGFSFTAARARTIDVVPTMLNIIRTRVCNWQCIENARGEECARMI